MAEQFVAYLADVPPGTVRAAEVTATDGTDITVAVAHTADGGIYAINDVCSHGEVSLAEGELQGCEIECWAHGARFDVRTGAATELPAILPVAAYPTRVDGNSIYVDVDQPLINGGI